MKTFAKKALAIIIILLSLVTLITQCYNFWAADTGVEVFKSIFLMFGGMIGVLWGIDSFHANKWLITIEEIRDLRQ